MNEDLDPAIAAILADLEGVKVIPPLQEWPDAKQLCLQLGINARNLPAFRLSMASTSTVDLAYELAVMDHLSRLLGVSDDPVAKLATPAVLRLRDICLAEGARRGVILSAGDDVNVISLAIELMDEMISTFTPPWAAGAP